MVINTKENEKKNLFKEKHVMKTISKFNMSAVSPHIQDWSLIDWKKIHEYVKKLRQRIFRAEQLVHTNLFEIKRWLEPDVWKHTSPVLKGERSCKAPYLPNKQRLLKI